jgi:uncharacterized UBP type Zn finger protein
LELLQALIREIRKEPDTRKIVDNIEMTIATCLHCFECRHTKIKLDETDLISLSLATPRDGTLKCLINNYFSEEYIEYNCESCSVSGIATKYVILFGLS